jgi:hypothetical protein
MPTAEIFATFLRRLLFAFLLLLLVAVATNAHGQNAGEVGVYTKLITVFTNQTSTSSSAIFQDNGFASNMLFFCNSSSFSGSIDLEWSPTGSAPFYPLVTGNYVTDNMCHTLQVGGYWPNLRSTVTRSIGTISAWYTASAAPISFFPAAIGSNGPTSPIQCDQFITSTVIANGTYQLFGTSSSRGLAVCAFTISFTGATVAQTDAVQVGYGTACAGAVYPWFISTTASTPQLLNVATGLGALFQESGGAAGICVGNHSGSGLEIAISYALL